MIVTHENEVHLTCIRRSVRFRRFFFGYQVTDKEHIYCYVYYHFSHSPTPLSILSFLSFFLLSSSSFNVKTNKKKVVLQDSTTWISL